MDLIKISSISLIIILVLNIVFLILGKISTILFWIIIIVAAIIARLMQKLKK